MLDPDHPIRSLRTLYDILLWRSPGSDETTAWSTYLSENPTLTLRGLAQGIMDSDEFLSKHPRHILPSIDDALGEFIVNGHRLLLPVHDTVYAHARLNAVYEPHVSKVITEYLVPKSTFLDIGANVGVHSIAAAARVGPNGSVLAIDASIENCAVLNKTARRFSVANLVVIPVAVGSSTTIENISTDDRSSNKTVRKEGGSGSQKVFVTTIDNLLGHVKRVDLVKIDVEGREGGVLRGARRLIERSRCPILAEYLGRDRNLYSDAEGHYTDELRSIGYSVSVVESNGSFTSLDGNPESLESAIAAERQRGGDHIDLLFRPS